MAMRRKLGNLADTLLQNHLAQRRASHQSELVKQRQLELAEQRQAELRTNADLNRQHEWDLAEMRSALDDKSGQTAARLGERFKHLVPSEDQLVGQMGTDIQKANDAKDLPADLEALLANSARPEMAKDPRHVERLQITRDAERESILRGVADQGATDVRARAVPQAVKSIDAKGTEQTDYLTPFEAAGQGPFQSGLSQQQDVSRQGAIAGAESAARLPAQLALERQQQLNRIDLAQKNREAEQLKLPPGVAEKVAGTDAALHSLEKIEVLYSTKADVNENIGPVAGRVQKARQTLPFIDPTSEDFAEFSAEISTLKNSVIKAVTGAQMSEPEAKRIMNQVPDITNKSVDFEARLVATKENMTFLRNRILELSNSAETPMDMPPNQTAIEAADPLLTGAKSKLEALRGRN